MKRPYYGWLVCLGGGLSIFCAMGLGINIFSLYQPYIISEYGLSNAQGSWIGTVRSLFSLLTTLCMGWIIPRLGLRKTLTISVLSSAISRLIFSFSRDFMLFCVGASFAGISYTMGSTIPLALLISNWFRSRKGLALGLTTACSGFANILLPPVILPIIQRSGLPASFLTESVLMFLMAVLVFCLVRDHPNDLGLKPFGDNETVTFSEMNQNGTTPLTTPMLYAVLGASGLIGISAGPGFAHIAVLYRTAGFSETAVALLLGIIGIALIAEKLLYGQINDLVGGLRSTLMMGASFVLGLSLCCLAPTGSFPVAVIAILCACFGFTFSSVTAAIWAGDLSGDIPYAKLLQWMTMSYMIGSLVTGPIPGVLTDWFGDYVPAYLFFVAVTVLAIGLITTVYIRLGVGKKPTHA